MSEQTSGPDPKKVKFDKYKVSSAEGLEYIPRALVLLSLQDLGYSPKLKEIQEALSQERPSQVGGLPWDEYVECCKKLEESKASFDELKNAFHLFDADKDGRLSRGEFTMILQNGQDALSPDEISFLLNRADPEKTGYIDCDGFVDHFCGALEADRMRREEEEKARQEEEERKAAEAKKQEEAERQAEQERRMKAKEQSAHQSRSGGEEQKEEKKKDGCCVVS